jgi:pimeloyl-ACP methyl ester carboxylesterase
MTPHRQKIADVDVALYEKTGDGTPIIFIHGISSSAKVFEGIWNDKRFTDTPLLAFDLPGHGNSSFALNPSEYTIIKLSKLVAEIINRKKLTGVVVVAHSIGAHLGIHASRFTDHINGMMLIGAAPCHNAESVPKGYVMSEDILAFFKSNVTDEELSRALQLEARREEHRAVLRHCYLKADGRARETMASEIGTFFTSVDFVSEVDLLRRPGLQTALVVGEYERLISRAYLESLDVTAWKNCVHAISESAHCPMLENRSEFAELLRGFVNDVELSVRR